jgi:hypothetical protein
MISNRGKLFRYLFETRFQNMPLGGWKETEGWGGLKLTETRQHPVSANDVNLLGVNLNSTMENTEALIRANKEVVLEGSTKKYITCMLHLRQFKQWFSSSQESFKYQNDSYKQFYKFILY